MASHTKTTTDHDEIRRWCEERGAKPSTVARTHKGNDVGLLRIDFPGYSGEGTLEEITWEEFFDKFDRSGLAFIYQEKTADGAKSNFCKLVSADTVEETTAKK